MNTAGLDSVDIDLSSHHANVRDGFSWQVNFNNLPSLKQTNVMFANKVGIPNIVGNVNRHSSEYRVLNSAGVVVATKTVPFGQYTGAELGLLLDTSHLTWVYDAAASRFIATTTASVAGQEFLIEANLDFFELVGFHEKIIEIDDTRTLLHRRSIGSTAGVAFTGAAPNLGGTTLFHVIAHGKSPNTFESADGQAHDVLYSGMFDSSTPYGFYRTYEAPDRRTNDIVHRVPVNMSEVRLTLVDHRMRPMDIPPNYPVFIICRCYHSDTTRD